MKIGLLALSKGIAYRMLIHYRRKGYNFRNILIVGSRQRARDVMDAIGDRLGSGYRLVGCLDVDQGNIGKEVENGIQVIGTVDEVENIIRKQVVDELIFAMPLKEIENAENAGQETGAASELLQDARNQIKSKKYKKAAEIAMRSIQSLKATAGKE